MINFRFHLVSLIAVFLALGLGILVGSTVIDQGIVNRLDSEINNVRKENSARKATSRQLSQQNSQLQQFVNQVVPFAGDGRLEGFSIALVAERGIDSDAVKQTEQVLVAAGAVVPGVLWLDDSWRLDSASRVQALQAALNRQGDATTVRAAALQLLVGRLAKAPTPPTTTTTKAVLRVGSGPKTSTSLRRGTTTTSTSIPATPRVDVLTALEQAGFLSVTDGSASAFAEFPGRAVDVLEVTGDDSDFAGSDLTAAFAHAAVDVKLPTEVAAVYDPGSDPANAPERGAALASILDDNGLKGSVSTVDDLDQIQGQIAAVLAFEVIGGKVGHYGYGKGASAPLPPHGS